jgi:hypothetical protein
LGTGTRHVGAPPKTIIDDGERHVVILTIWDADAERIEAFGEPNREVNYGYVLLGLREK